MPERAMKDSGIEWIGEIPNSWDVFPARYAFSEIKKKNTDGKETNALKFYNGTIVKKQNFDADSDDYVAETITNYTVVEPNTIMINGLNLNYDLKSLRVGMVKEKGIITSAYLALRPNERILPNFANYLFKGYEAKMAFHNMGEGIRKTLGFREFKNQPILLPSISEQSRIADFLDKKVSEIDAVISKTKESIEEYKKIKLAVIAEAVTKGINQKGDIQETGNMWIPTIHKGWKMSRVGLHFNIILGKMLCSTQLSNEHSLEPYFCAANVHFGGVDHDNLKMMWFSNNEKKQYLVSPGDLLVVEGGAGAGGCAIVKELTQPTYVQNSIMIVRPKNNCRVRYLKYLLELLVNSGYIDLVCNKATIPHFTKDKLASVPFPMSNEQEIIADYLDDKCIRYDKLITKKEKIITELEEYKKSLIYEYITGKKEVV